MPQDLNSPFKDYIVPKAGFEVKDTLGTTPGQPTDGSQGQGVTSRVVPKELPSQVNDLWHGPSKV